MNSKRTLPLDSILKNLPTQGSNGSEIRYVSVQDINNVTIFPDDHGFNNIAFVWVDAGVLDSIWQQDRDNYKSEWNGEPKAVWFYEEDPAKGIRPPIISIIFSDDIADISFSDGRHRTRWMISNMALNRLPVGIHEDMIEPAVKIGLVIRRATSTDTLGMGT